MSDIIHEGFNITRSAKRQTAKQNFYHFLQLFWKAVVPGEAPVWNWHIEYLCQQLQAINDRVAQRLPKLYDYYIINVPPGSSKSTIGTIAYPIWCWVNDPTQRFICASYAEDIAIDLANKAMRILEDEEFKALFPEMSLLKRKNLTHLENFYGGERYTAATGSAVTGKHAHQIIIDDPLNPKKAVSDVELKIATDYVTQTLSTRMVDKQVTPTIIIMQRLHELDPTGYILSKQAEGLRVKHICLPGEVDPKLDNVKPAGLKRYYVNGLFDPVRQSPEVLQQMRSSLGSYGYAGQFLQNPAPAEGGLLKKEWFRIVTTPPPAGVVVNFVVDGAYEEKRKGLHNDPTGLMAYYMFRNEMFIVGMESVYKDMPELVAYIPIFCRKYGYSSRSVIRVEPKANGISVIQTLRQGTQLNVVKGRPPKDNKETRVRAISAKIESGRVNLHLGGWNEEFLNQCAAFPNARHDEMVDLLAEAAERELLQDSGWYGFKRVTR